VAFCLAQAHLQSSILLTSTSVTLTLHSHPQLPITSLVYIVNGSAYKDRKSAKPDSNAKRPKTRFAAPNPPPPRSTRLLHPKFFDAAVDFSIVTSDVSSAVPLPLTS
jgi:hypothetical protein